MVARPVARTPQIGAQTCSISMRSLPHAAPLCPRGGFDDRYAASLCASSPAASSRARGAVSSPSRRMNSTGSVGGHAHQRRLEAQLAGDPRQPLGLEELRRVVEADVDRAHDLRRVAVGALRRLVDRRVAVGSVRLAHVVAADRRQPAVGEPAGQPQHPRAVGAEPDADRVRRRRARPAALRRVVLAVEAERLAVEEGADQLDRLGRARRPTRPACAAARPSPRPRPRRRRRRARAPPARRSAGRARRPTSPAPRAGAAAG